MLVVKKRGFTHKNQAFVAILDFSRPTFLSKNKEMPEFLSFLGALIDSTSSSNSGLSLTTF